MKEKELFFSFSRLPNILSLTHAVKRRLTITHFTNKYEYKKIDISHIQHTNNEMGIFSW